MGNANAPMEIFKRNLWPPRQRRFATKTKKQRDNNRTNSTYFTSGPIRTILRPNIHNRRKQAKKKHKPSKIIHHKQSATINNKQKFIKDVRKSMSLNPRNNRLSNANWNAFSRFKWNKIRSFFENINDAWSVIRLQCY